MNLNADAILVLGGGATLLIVLFALFGSSSPSRSAEKRLARVSNSVPTHISKEAASTLRRNTSDTNIAFFDAIIKKFLPNPQKMRERLAKTGRSITLGHYLTLNVVAIVVSFCLFRFVWEMDQVISLSLGIAVGLFLPHKVTGSMGARRVRKFIATFPEAIDTICRGLRSGLPITETIVTVGHEMPDPIGTEFSRVGDAVRMGIPLEVALWDVAPKLDTPEFRFFVVSLAIQRETGGNLAETLGNLADLLRRRRQLQLKIRAMSSEARASAMIIGSLPFIMFTLLMIVNSEYVMVLLNDPKGKVLLGIGLGWLSMGVFVMKQMVNFDI